LSLGDRVHCSVGVAGGQAVPFAASGYIGVRLQKRRRPHAADRAGSPPSAATRRFSDSAWSKPESRQNDFVTLA
jgi:hypothetical protein